jgi:hypothetical protein
MGVGVGSGRGVGKRGAGSHATITDASTLGLAVSYKLRGVNCNSDLYEEAHVTLHGTALIAAVVGGHTEVVQLLLERGAEAGGANGAAALRNAKGNNRVQALLREHGAMLTLHEECLGGNMALVAQLLNDGENVEGESGVEALRSAGANDEVRLLLVRHGAPTSLHDECRAGNVAVVTHLLESGADVEAMPGERRPKKGDIVSILDGKGTGSCATITDSRGRSGDAKAVVLKLLVGVKVEAQRQGSQEHNPGTIVAIHRNDTYDVEFDDGARDRAVPGASIKTIFLAEGAEGAYKLQGMRCGNDWYTEAQVTLQVTALVAAAVSGHAAVVGLLLERGAKSDAVALRSTKDRKTKSLLQAAHTNTQHQGDAEEEDLARARWEAAGARPAAAEHEMGDWHYLLSAPDGTPNAGDQVGPVPWADLEREYGGGNLINESMVWGPSLPNRTAINDAPDIKAKLNPAPAPSHGATQPQDDTRRPETQVVAQAGAHAAVV